MSRITEIPGQEFSTLISTGKKEFGKPDCPAKGNSTSKDTRTRGCRIIRARAPIFTFIINEP